MMGIPISELTHIYGDSAPAFHHSSKPESTLKKRCNKIAYHAVWKSMAMS